MNPLITENQIVNNNNGIAVYGAFGGMISRNKISDNIIGIFAEGNYAGSKFNFNNVYDNQEYNVSLYLDNADIDVSKNWWNTTNEAEIEGKINDYYKDINLGKAIYKPFSLSEIDINDDIKPILSLKTSISASSDDKTPSLTFNSSEDGSIFYSGTCGNGNIFQAVAGENTVTYDLNLGTYNDCSIVVTDAAGNSSDILAIPPFAVVATPVASSEKNINAFALAGNVGIINETNNAVSVKVPYGTAITSIAPTIAVSENASINPASGTIQDFSKPVVYTVTAADNSTKIYTVTVVVGAASSSSSGGGGSYTPPVTTVTSSDKPLQISSSQQGTLSQSLSGQNKVTVEIPKGSVRSKTTFDIKEGSLSGNDTPENGTGAFLFSGLVFNINATDGSNNAVKSFDQNLTITLTVSELPKDTSSLKLYYFDEVNKNG